MAYWYCDYAGGNNTTGDGSAANPYMDLDGVKTVCGVGDEVRWAGQAEVSIAATFTWTSGSTTVTVPGDQTGNIAVGDYIRPDRSTLWANPRFRVTAVSYDGSTTTTITLETAWYDYDLAATWAGAVIKTPYYSVTAANGVVGLQLVHTGGWRLSDETQPSGWVTAFDGGNNSNYFNHGSGSVYLPDASLFFFARIAYSTWGAWAAVRWEGIADLYNTGARYSYQCRVDTLITARVWTFWPNCWFRRAWILGTNWSLCGSEIHAVNPPAAASLVFGKLVAHASMALSGPSSDEYPFLTIGYLDTNGQTVTVNATGEVFLGGPAALWQLTGNAGIVDLTTGRGGTGYCYRFTPSWANIPRDLTVATLADASQAVALRFWCYCTGATAPECYIEVREGNGLDVVATIPFTPALGSSWADATEQVLDLTGTTAQKGSLQVAICVCNNLAEDAVVYVDDITWDGAGDQADTSGLDYLGLSPIIQKTSAAGGGLPFPLGL